MVIEKHFKGKTVYECEACQMLYPTKKRAETCEAWCMKHKSCNIQIIKHAIHTE